MQTAERSSHLDPSENVIFQRHMIAYKEASKLISGTVLDCLLYTSDAADE